MATEIRPLMWLRLVKAEGALLQREPASDPEDARDVALTMIGRTVGLEPGTTLYVTKGE